MEAVRGEMLSATELLLAATGCRAPHPPQYRSLGSTDLPHWLQNAIPELTLLHAGMFQQAEFHSRRRPVVAFRHAHLLTQYSVGGLVACRQYARCLFRRCR